MSQSNLKTLITKNNAFCKRTLEAAAGLCLSRTHHYVEVEHWMLKLLEEKDADISLLFGYFSVDSQRVTNDINRYCERLKSGNMHPPALSPYLVNLLNKAWLTASLEFGEAQIRSAYLLYALLADESLTSMARDFSRELDKIDLAALKTNIKMIIADSCEETHSVKKNESRKQGKVSLGSNKTPALDQYTIDLTARARNGEIDPVIGRDHEIRQIIDILSRRRQNNPILTGEAGVGKTAVVEGFALKLINGEVPLSLKNISLKVLDLGLLQAGAGVKGEFENRLKEVIKEVQSSDEPIVLFIDEAHTMIGAGGQAGQGDAANLLKPALARGELRTIAATTWAEYKKYFEKDAALARRFQVVKIDEPSEEKAIQMLRGLAHSMAKHHSVDILNEAIEDAVRLSSRYISGRQLPDKAIGLLDTACARVQLSQASVPSRIEAINFQIYKNTTELALLTQENHTGKDHSARLDELESLNQDLNGQLSGLQSHFEQELALIEEIKSAKQEISIRLKNSQVNSTTSNGDQTNTKTNMPAKDSPHSLQQMTEQLRAVQDKLTLLQGNLPMVFECVDAQVIAEVVADWTGIPVGKMQSDEVKTVLDLQKNMERRVVGQSHALQSIVCRVQTSRAKLTDPNRPIGVFMLAGPSGVGKTETALALAEQVYGSEKNVTVINMSEFKEEHKVSLLMGSPPGYVGYGEGGVLTEAVRRKPYSVILLDEIEKAHPGVQDIFYQVFDKGMLKDGEGRDIDFKNTIIIMTSNVGTDTIMKLADDPDTMPDAEALAESIKDDLLTCFKPAFLGRISIVPFYPLTDQVLRSISQIQINKVVDRVANNYATCLSFDEAVVNSIVARCTEVDSGARNIHQIINNTILPELSLIFLNEIIDGKAATEIKVTVKNDNFDYQVVMDD